MKHEKIQYILERITEDLKNALRYYQQEKKELNVSEEAKKYLFSIGKWLLEDKEKIKKDSSHYEKLLDFIKVYINNDIEEDIKADEYFDTSLELDSQGRVITKGIMQEDAVKKFSSFEKKHKFLKYNMKWITLKALQILGLSEETLQSDALISTFFETFYEKIIVDFEGTVNTIKILSNTEVELEKKMVEISSELANTLAQYIKIEKNDSKENIIVIQSELFELNEQTNMQDKTDISISSLCTYFRLNHPVASYDIIPSSLSYEKEVYSFDLEKKTFTYVKEIDRLNYQKEEQTLYIESERIEKKYNALQQMVFLARIESKEKMPVEKWHPYPYANIFESYTLETQDENRAYYTHTLNGETIINLENVEVKYDKIITNFLRGEQRMEEEYINSKGDPYSSSNRCLEKLLTLHNIKYIYRYSDPLFASTNFDFSKEDMLYRLGEEIELSKRNYCRENHLKRAKQV